MRFSTFVKQSELVLARLKSIEAKVLAIEKEPITPQLITKLTLLDSTATAKNNDFDKLVNKLFGTVPLPEELDESENITTISTLQDEISDLYVSIHSLCVNLIPSPSSNQSSQPNLDDSNAAISQVATTKVSVQLPKLQLGTFSGQHEKWMAFKNLFENTIHKNDSISGVEKMSYLLSCLEGEALSVVKNIPMTNANYFIAWESLLKRYQNTRLLISLHVNNVLDLPVLHNPSVKQLRRFLSVLNENIEALKALDEEISQENLILTSHLLRKFDSDFRHHFEQSRSDNSVTPKLDELTKYIESHCVNLEAANLTNVGSSLKGTLGHHTQVKPPQRSNKSALIATPRTVCTFCSGADHKIYQCKGFLKLTSQEMYNFVKGKNLCTNCLGDKHNVKECKSWRTCSTCKRKHHSLLHFMDSENNPSPNVSKGNTDKRAPSSDSNKNESGFVGLTNTENTVLLATALIVVKSSEGKTLVCRGVLDSAAQSTFITQRCAQSLGIKRSHANKTLINGISSAQVKTKGLTHVTLQSLSGYVLASSHPVFILDNITPDLPRAKITPEVRSQMQHLMLADPTFDKPAPIDVLIGADLFASSVKGQFLSLGENMPVAIDTIFGYALLGSTPVASTCKNSFHGLVTLLTTNSLDLHTSIQQFWAVEEPPLTSKQSLAEEKCEKHFVSTHSRTPEGRYIVSLPFSDDPSTLGNSSKMAKSLFWSLENKFRSNPDFKETYVDFMRDYLSSGHMTLCQSPRLKNNPHYYLPHHGIFKDGKLRVVFNASAPTSTSLSLNSILHQGPKLHNNICDIILNFRRHAVVFSCDIKQMFRQVLVKESDQIFQLIFWRENDKMPLQIYQLATVTYGLTSSPYLANRVIQQLIIDEGKNHPLAATALKDQIYVDDALLGSNCVENALLLKNDVVQLLKKGGFELRKWSSNNPLLLQSIPEDHKEKPIGFRAPEQPVHSVLGLKWIPNEDVFSYSVGTQNIKETPTKRIVLSVISQIYDPSGWLTPVTFWSKSFMQYLWTLGLDWDEPLDDSVISVWNKFANELPYIEMLKIPRYVGLSSAKDIQLHAFSDASEAGYCSCVYLRVVNSQGIISTYLLIAKSRVAPLKRISIPRLELCGAHLMSKLLNYCIQLLSPHCKISSYTAWCDSTIVLSWIGMPSYRLKVYVSNRVAEIQENIPPSFWQHISSLENPADVGSRGTSPQDLINHTLWWNGPVWLCNSEENWPKSVCKSLPEESIPETKILTVNTLSAVPDEPFSLLTRFSSWTTLLHVSAYLLRFIHNTRNKVKQIGNLTSQEIKEAHNLICKLVQREYFSEEISCLKSNKPCSVRLRRLAPYLDKDGLIRVGGRLNKADISEDHKHPVLLPKGHRLVDILIDHHHVLYLHSGPTLTQAMLANKYWILSARSLIRSRIFKCIKCFRCKPPHSSPLMGELPMNRVTPSRPFSISGVDYAGHFFVKQHLLRRVQPIKVYICIFICFSTKAVHIEVVTDLTADAYLAALTRFVSRRGIVSDIHCDNATNFTGASEKLRRNFENLIKDSTVQRYAEKFNIKFHFLPPHAPHQGGLWERAVKSVKFHLIRVIGQQTLSLEEFSTLITRIEGMMNSRPITPLSSDPSDLEALTPGHFLVGGPLMTPLEPDLRSIPINRLKRWQVVQQFSQHIWARWQKEYLYTLQERNKWVNPKKNIEVNDLVVIHEDNLPPLSWKFGRVLSVSPGTDGIVRVVHLKTASGHLSRPVTKVSVLPME